MKIAVFGSGSVGSKLAKLFSDAGYSVLVCGKQENKEAGILSFEAGAIACDAVALAIPFVALQAVLPSLDKILANKIVIDCTNPLNDDWSPLVVQDDNGHTISAGEAVAAMLPSARVVKAFNTIFADVMSKEYHDRDGQRISAFVAGDDTDAVNTVQVLANAIGFAPIVAGPLVTARYIEAIAHLNIQLAVGQGGGTNAAFVYHQVRG